MLTDAEPKAIPVRMRRPCSSSLASSLESSPAPPGPAHCGSAYCLVDPHSLTYNDIQIVYWFWGDRHLRGF